MFQKLLALKDRSKFLQDVDEQSLVGRQNLMPERHRWHPKNAVSLDLQAHHAPADRFEDLGPWGEIAETIVTPDCRAKHRQLDPSGHGQRAMTVGANT